MSFDDIRAQLEEAGIPTDSWGEAGGQTVQPPIIEQQKRLLIQVRELLKGQVQKDKAAISRLHADVQRMKHGGGV